MTAKGSSKTNPENISVHPPQTEVISNAFASARNAAEFDQDALEKIIGVLDQEWEGSQKTRFLEALRNTADRILNPLIAQLRLLEKKYRDSATEMTTEETGAG